MSKSPFASQVRSGEPTKNLVFRTCLLTLAGRTEQAYAELVSKIDEQSVDTGDAWIWMLVSNLAYVSGRGADGLAAFIRAQACANYPYEAWSLHSATAALAAWVGQLDLARTELSFAASYVGASTDRRATIDAINGQVALYEGRGMDEVTLISRADENWRAREPRIIPALKALFVSFGGRRGSALFEQLREPVYLPC